MRKYLLATTTLIAASALASPSFAADPIKLKLGGYFAGFAAFVDDDAPAGERDFAFGSDAEVHIKGSTTLDNGIKVGFSAEFELEDDADAGKDDTVDEFQINASGGFGKIIFGQEDGVSSKMRIKTPTPFMRVGADDVEDVNLIEGVPGDYETEIGDDDSLKIIYNTPRLGGFQFGISYAPEKGKNSQGLADRTETDGDEILEAGLNFEHEANGVTFGIGGTYLTDDRMAGDSEHYNISAQVAFSGFTFGGNYTSGDNLAVRKAAHKAGEEASIYSLGGVYENGPWKIGAQWFMGDEDVSGDEYTSYLGGVTYEFGPKMQIGAGIQYSEFDDATIGAADPDGTAFFVETGLKF